MLKKLPVGISSFKKIREEECVYVDKTKRILELVKSGDYFFLARPRRFGKSLLLDTLDHLFRGDKELFDGLYIYKDWKWEEKYPVIHISMSADSQTSETLRDSLTDTLNDVADNNNIALQSLTLRGKFLEIIKQLYKKHNQKVVILIDEYDKPVLDQLDAMYETDASRANKTVLNNFYSVLKDNPDYLHRVFLTGVTRFSGLSVFSGLNNLIDLTLDKRFGDICGYTQKELETNFSGHIKALAQEEKTSYDETLAKIKHWYDGYTWDSKTEMYNPFSTLNLFNKNEFGMYWFASGPPNYLISYIKQAKKTNLFFDEQIASATKLMNFNPAGTTPVALLFQTGYLTIKDKKDRVNDEPNYLIDSPNLEVRKSLARHVLLSFGDEVDEDIISLSSQFLKSAIDEDAKAFAQTALRVFVHLPYTINETKNENKDEGGEAFYHAMLVCSMISMGFDVTAEKITNLGRVDIVWKYQNKVFIIEVKFVDIYEKERDETTREIVRTNKVKTDAEIAKEIDEKIESALSQIKDKKYYEQYMLAKKEVILVGLAVSTKAQDVKARFERL
jgi:hypothetical protein